MADTKLALQEAKGRIATVAQASPEVMKGFAVVSRTATRGGKLSSGNKELMAIVVAVVTGCDDCILYHVDAAKRHDVDQEMLIEALEVAIEMGGGPAVMYAGKALEAFRGPT